MLFKKSVPTEDLDYSENDHSPIYRFFSCFGTHFLKLVLVNVMFLIFNIPSMLVAFGYCLIFLPMLNPVFVPKNFIAYMNELGIVGNSNINDVGTDAGYQLYYLIIVFSVMFLIGSLLICIGPFQSGFATIYRNIARGNGTFLWSDFKDGVKENWKKSLVTTFVTWLLTAILMLGIAFYANHFGRFGTAISVFFAVLFCFLLIINNMVHYMIATVDLPLKKIYKNAILFFLIKLIPCLGLILLEVILLVVIPCVLLFTTTYFAYAIAVVYYFTVAFVLCQFMISFFTNEMVNTYVVTKNDESENEEYTDNEGVNEN